MNVFGKAVVDETVVKEHAKLKVENAELEKNSQWLLGHVLSKSGREVTDDPYRPNIDQLFTSTSTGAKIPIFPFPRHFLYQMVKTIDVLRIPIDVINRETLRNGLEIVPEFRYLCKKCGMEYQSKPIDPQSSDVKCDECGNTDLVTPKPANRKKLAKLLRDALNNNGQKIKDVMKEIERDLEIADDGYMLLLKKYVIEDGQIVKSKLVEVMSAHPPQVFMIADYQGRLGFDERGNRVYVCPKFEHREKRVYVSSDPEGRVLPKNQNPKGKNGRPLCPECNTECLLAIAEMNTQYAVNIPTPRTVIYAKGEIIHSTGKWWSGKVYGYSNIYTLWSKALAMSYMDEYVRKYFDKQRPPKGLLVIGSRNYDSLQKSFDKLKVDTKQDPYGLHALMVETERGGRNMVQYVDLTGSLQDLQFIEVRDEFRRSIGAMYGVLPLFSGDFPTGWNQEGLEMAVTNRAVQTGQDFLKEKFLKPLCMAVGVKDWVIQLVRGEETDELRDEQFKAQKIQNATMMANLGYEHHLDGEGEFVFGQYPTQVPSGEGESELLSNATRTEDMTNHEGEKLTRRPSDAGGVMEGHPASGDNTSMSNKSKNYTRVKGYYR